MGEDKQIKTDSTIPGTKRESRAGQTPEGFAHIHDADSPAEEGLF